MLIFPFFIKDLNKEKIKERFENFMKENMEERMKALQVALNQIDKEYRRKIRKTQEDERSKN